MKKLNGKKFLEITIAIVVLLQITACTVKELEDEHPVVSEASVPKSFFVDFVKQKVGNKNTTIQKSKNFLCGWASVGETGQLSKHILTHNANMTDHCNIEFEINEKSLDGFLINPSYPNDRNKWLHVISIPILKHYYYERAKDGAYRETHKFEENTMRSHWSARTHMQLDFSGLVIKDWAYETTAGGAQINSIEDLEWDFKNNFLGFTANISGTIMKNFEQASIRFNFLKFDHNPNFKKTFYHEQNSKYLNVLHILGKKVEGVHSQLYVGKWDLNKTHEIYLSGFPDKYVGIAHDIVKEWNDTFYEISKKRPFVIKTVNEVEFGFDLRRNTLIWVDDLEISRRSPLGIGIALADVRNGEFKWASNVLYGGLIEGYIKKYAGSDSLLSGKSQQVLMRRADDYNLNPTFNFKFPFLEFDVSNSYNQWLNLATNKNTSEAFQLSNPIFSLENINKIKTHFDTKLSADQARVGDFFSVNDINSILKLPGDESTLNLFKLDKDANLNSKLSSLKQQLLAKVNSENSMTMDLGRTFEAMLPAYLGAISENPQSNLDEVTRVVIKELMLHEFGHILGLGHQFKENILPKKGSVPDKYYNALKEKATKEAGYTNATSVMGYKDPRTEILQKYEETVPGPQDKLTLRYIYNQEYPVYKMGSSEFKYIKFNTSTPIPLHLPGDDRFKTSYFPHCNDLYASLSTDPYCNRFDRGFDAKTIMQNYISSMTTNLVASLNAHTDLNNSNAEARERYLWYKSISTYGRIRVFYDYMRLKYQDELEQFSNDKDSLLIFSRACQGGVSNEKLEILFNKNPELKDLCVANSYALSHFNNILALHTSDYTKRDYDNMYAVASVTGGDLDLDYGRVFGSWTELSSLPIKISALNVLTTALPYVNFGWLVPIPIYTSPNEKFHYSSFYPREYSTVISTTVNNNLKFKSLGDEKTRIGSSVLSLGYFMNQVYMSNDTNRYKEIMEEINKQSNFRFSLVAILIDKLTNETGADPNRVFGFSGKIFDMRSGKTSSLQTVNILPEGKVIIKANPGSIIYPVTNLEFVNDPSGKTWGNGYVMAIKMDFEDDKRSQLQGISVKSRITDTYNNVLSSCLDGNGKGIRSFFNGNNKDNFKGFYIQPGIANDSAKKQEFLNSVEDAFKTFEGKIGFNQNQCDYALDGIGQIISAAGLLNGMWMPHTGEYVIK